ncbi:MAG: TolC family protein [Spirochaetaceae bacterium]|nr:TolC family protein [Spirochaetaceae bacterium]
MTAAKALLLCSLLGAAVLAAQETASPEAPGLRALTLEEACELALQNSISLQTRAIDLELDRISAKSLWAQVFPSISAGGSMGYEFPVQDDVPRTSPSYTARLRLSLGLNAGLPYTMKNISLAYKSGLLNYGQASRQLLAEISRTFYALLARKMDLEVLEGAMKLAGDQLERDRVSRRNGYIGELDFLSSTFSAEDARLKYNRALSDYRIGTGNFLSALGLPAGEAEGIVLEGTAEIIKLDLDAEALIRAGLSRRPDIMLHHNEIERLKNARNETALSARGPSVSLGASWGASAAGGFDDTVSAEVSVTIPVDPWIPRTKRDQDVKRASAEYQKALLELGDMENAARQEIRSYADNIRNTWMEVEIARLQAASAERAYELASQAYRQGAMNFLNFETVRNRLTAARQGLLQSEFDYKILVLDLAASLSMEEGELHNFVVNEGTGER